MLTLNRHNVRKEITAFSKAQLAAFVGGLVDFGVMLGLTELFGIHYVYSIIVGGLIGAVVNYTINRHWSFKSKGALPQEMAKFVVVVIGSIALKSLGTYLLTEWVLLDYRMARLITDAFVCFGFNYVLHRFWVFK